MNDTPTELARVTQELNDILLRAEDVLHRTYTVGARVRVCPQYGQDYLVLREHNAKRRLFHERLRPNGTVKHSTRIQSAPRWFRIEAANNLNKLVAALDVEVQRNEARLEALNERILNGVGVIRIVGPKDML
jgi:hypothetical protein